LALRTSMGIFLHAGGHSFFILFYTLGIQNLSHEIAFIHLLSALADGEIIFLFSVGVLTQVFAPARHLIYP
jgi:hypothetical protein